MNVHDKIRICPLVCDIHGCCGIEDGVWQHKGQGILHWFQRRELEPCSRFKPELN